MPQAGEPLALAAATRVVQEVDQRQPPSNADLAPPARGALLETSRVAAHAIRTVHAPVTLLAAAQHVATYLVAVAEPVAQRAAAEATAESTEARAVFGRDGLFSRACVTIFRRLVARRGPRSPADAGPLRG